MKEQFHAVRRAYRAASKISLLVPGSLESRNAALYAMRAMTGKLEDCRPIHPMSAAKRIWLKKGPGGCYRLPVYAACTRFLAKH